MKMKKSLKYICLLLLLILLGGFSYIFRFSLSTSEIVLEVEVVDSDTTVRSVTLKPFITQGQGWSAIKAEVKRVKTGKIDAKFVIVENIAHRSSNSPLWNKWDCMDGKKYQMSLILNHKLSLWCQQRVFTAKDMSEIKL